MMRTGELTDVTLYKYNKKERLKAAQAELAAVSPGVDAWLGTACLS